MDKRKGKIQGPLSWLECRAGDHKMEVALLGSLSQLEWRRQRRKWMEQLRGPFWLLLQLLCPLTLVEEAKEEDVGVGALVGRGGM